MSFEVRQEVMQREDL